MITRTKIKQATATTPDATANALERESRFRHLLIMTIDAFELWSTAPHSSNAYRDSANYALVRLQDEASAFVGDFNPSDSASPINDTAEEVNALELIRYACISARTDGRVAATEGYFTDAIESMKAVLAASSGSDK